MEKQVRYKSKDGKRFIINVHDNSAGIVYSLGFCALDIDNNYTISAELYFGIHDLLRIMWKLEDKNLLYNFLFRRGLQLIEEKIDSNNPQKEVIVIESSSVKGDFPYKIVNGNDIYLETPQEKYKKNYLVQKDILGYLYSKRDNLATSREIIEHAWCDDDLLGENIFFLNKNEFISGPRFTPEMIAKGGDDNVNISTIITINGKKRFEEMLKEEATILDENLKYFEKWVPFASNKYVFLAHRFNEEQLINQVKDEITKAGFNYKEGKVSDLGYITDDILTKIKECGFFFVLITSLKEYKVGGCSTSSWLLMEIGVAISYDRRCLILAEDAVDAEEFARKLQPDVQYETFNRVSDFPEKLKTTIERLKAEYKKH